ncbi:MAG: RNA methyltransferase [Chlamydiia bacterium]|nr:RNA methyltransferase [Chlamydiia bacterium]
MLKELLSKYPQEEIIKTLAPFLTRIREERIEGVLKRRIGSVHLAVEAPYDIHNGLAIIRTGEALGISHLHFINAQMKKGQGKNTTKGTLKWTHLHRHQNLESFFASQKGQCIAGASLEGELTLDDLPVDRPLTLLFGNEREGLTEDAVKRCDLLFRIPMYGMVESLNVSVAAAITLYDYLKRKRLAFSREGDLTPKEMIEEKARFYVRSVGIEEANQILKRSENLT